MVCLMTVAFMGYLMDIDGTPTPPPLPQDAAYPGLWWNLWSGATPGEVVRLILFIAAGLIFIATVWEFIRPHVGREPFKVANPCTQNVRSHRMPKDGYRGKRRRSRRNRYDPPVMGQADIERGHHDRGGLPVEGWHHY